jgi:hypothetical protein
MMIQTAKHDLVVSGLTQFIIDISNVSYHIVLCVYSSYNYASD